MGGYTRIEQNNRDRWIQGLCFDDLIHLQLHPITPYTRNAGYVRFCGFPSIQSRL